MVLSRRSTLSESVHVTTGRPVVGSKFVRQPLKFAVSVWVRSSNVTLGGYTGTGEPLGARTCGITTMLPEDWAGARWATTAQSAAMAVIIARLWVSMDRFLLGRRWMRLGNTQGTARSLRLGSALALG